MRTKNIIIILAALALCCFASSCVKQNDFDSFTEETDSHLATVEGQMASLKELTATLGEEHDALKVYVAALGVGFEEYAAEVNALLEVLDRRLDAAEDTVKNLQKKSYFESTFATIATVDSLGDVAAVIKVKVKSDSTVLADSINKKTAASEKKIMEIFGSYYTSALIDEKIKVLSDKLDTLSSDMDTAVFKHIDTLKTHVKTLGASSIALAQKLKDEVAALKQQDTIMINQITALDQKYLKGLKSLADSVSADSARIEDLKARVTKLEDKVQSVRVVPDYSDGKVNMKKGDTEIKFDVRPVSAAKAMATKTSAFSFQIIEALATTKASIYTDITVKSAKMSGADSLLVLTIDGTTMPADFFTGAKLYNARLRISDAATTTDCSSSYFPLTRPIYPEAPDSICVTIKGITWAPVNCGYDATSYPYGKLYQWGRVSPCEYNNTWTDGSGSHAAEKLLQTTTAAEFNSTTHINDSLSVAGFNNWFYTNGSDSGTADWYADNTASQLKDSWPMKSGDAGYMAGKIANPCPSGWRVPTYDELNTLFGGNSKPSLETVGEQKGAYFNGTSAPGSTGVFLPAAGSRGYNNGSANLRGSAGRYWSSSVSDNHAMGLDFVSGIAKMCDNRRANGFSVRCVME